MSTPKIRRGDTVVIITGKDRGKRGKVLQVLAETQRILVEGLNLAVDHVRPRRDRQKGQRVQVPKSLHISNVMLVDPKSDKPTRVGRTVTDGTKQRIARRSGAVLS
ncbi:MAG: 50S ribosomal protein L24 [Candidatus Kerfeldbacteria bacterium]|nr:50S ribosomal protein L24 [Candidatus Kerfeldbacteria bacterium]